MTSLVVYGFIALIAVGVLFGLAVLLLPPGEQMAPAAPDVKPWALDERPLRAQDVIEVKLPVAMRGYRFAETDALLDRLTEELRRRDDEIARLSGTTSPGAATFEPRSAAPLGFHDGSAQYQPVPGYAPTPAQQPDYDPTAVREQ